MAIDPNALEKLHMVELEIMDAIHALCREYRITYYLCGGSAIGAKRHGGFIPWDDDIDIAMPRPDYERFIKLCREGLLPKSYFLHHSSTDSVYTLAFAKVRKDDTFFPEPDYRKDTRHSGIFVDIFPLDFIKSPESRLNLLRGNLVELSKKLIFRKREATLPDSFAGKLIYWLSKPISLRTIIKARDWLASFHRAGNYYTCYGGVYGYRRDTYPTRVFGTPTPAPFEDRVYLIPEHCEEYLEILYGNWRQLPPPEARRWHCSGEIIFDTKAQ